MEFVRFEGGTQDWAATLAPLPGGLVCQSDAWLAFLQASQRGEPIRAVLRDGDRTVGAFAGMVVRRFGLRLLGSPIPGWTTPYMGLDLLPGVERSTAIQALIDFAWHELGCVHLEMMDRHLRVEDVEAMGLQHRMFNTWEVDLRDSDDELLASFSTTARRFIRKGIANGLVVEEAHDDAFVDDYYTHLTDVFARQHLVPTYPKSRVEHLIASVPRDQLLLMRVRTADGTPAATGIFHAVDRVRVYGWGFASLRALQPLHPNELLMFHAMNIWRQRGFAIMDLGGDGEYKRKYHPRRVAVPWIRISRYPFLPALREAVRRGYEIRQSALGRRPAMHRGSVRPDRPSGGA